MQALRLVLGDVLSRMGKKRICDQAVIALNWDAAVGNRIRRHASPITLRGRVLTVATDSPVWSHELSMLRVDLLKRINALVGRDIVEDIRFRARASAVGPGGRKEAAVRPPLGASELLAIEKIVADLGDGPTKDKLRNLLVRDKQCKREAMQH